MHTISKQAIVAYSAEKMYTLVNDVNRYSEFLSWCKSAEVVSQEGNEVYAYIAASKGPFNQKFSTKNTLRENSSIIMQLLNGPFKHLEGKWEFIPLSDDACKVLFHLEFSFSSRILDMALAPYFKTMSAEQLDAFILRAKDVYA